MTRNRATMIGFLAILLWALLALFTVGTDPVPPFQLTAICFAMAAVIGIVWTTASRGWGELRQVSWKVYAFGTAGVFGYHALYFTALRYAPPAEAGLIAYLWPLLIVLFSGLLPGEKLGLGHVLGAIISFAGAALILVQGTAGFAASAMPGYIAAGFCALTWSSYSVLSRRLGAVPTNSVTVFCLLTAVLSFCVHSLTEQTVWPTGLMGWSSLVALGLGPVGIAFYVWDIGVKQGDIQLLGVASYAAPLLSTLVLVLAGIAPPKAVLIGAAVLITMGAWLAARASKKG